MAVIDSKSERELLLLVEGLNDCHAVFQLMWLVYGGDPIFGIHECGNDNRVLDSLASRIVSTRPKQKVLGVILDSDVEGVSPEQVIQSRLDQLKARVGTYYTLPATFPHGGLILNPLASRPDADRLPKLGVWLMPNNKAYGMFEDLLMASLADQASAYTAAVVMRAKTDGVARYKDVHLSKAVIRTYMAWQDPPDVQYLGLAIKLGAFERIEAECRPFVEWLERLFGSSTPKLV
ncbi:MAG TPA: DUF3226 domain-containing protein [Candidatus Sulfopaludibacter sp.]|jgi:hypothetical protein|nr:DUF3226 domain-containing protein [Candidatus Sulfopaludibacter sp.]